MQINYQWKTENSMWWKMACMAGAAR